MKICVPYDKITGLTSVNISFNKVLLKAQIDEIKKIGKYNHGKVNLSIRLLKDVERTPEGLLLMLWNNYF